MKKACTHGSRRGRSTRPGDVGAPASARGGTFVSRRGLAAAAATGTLARAAPACVRPFRDRVKFERPDMVDGSGARRRPPSLRSDRIQGFLLLARGSHPSPSCACPSPSLGRRQDVHCRRRIVFDRRIHRIEDGWNTTTLISLSLPCVHHVQSAAQSPPRAQHLLARDRMPMRMHGNGNCAEAPREAV
jgi:hypothetical protein